MVLLIRKILEKDYYKNYLNLISQLTDQDINCTYKQFINHLKNIKSQIYVIEIEDKIIASITLLFEKKFIHNLSKVCHIEDVIVDKDYHKKGIGTKLINFSINKAKEEECYKIILNCKDKLYNFYNKFGFKNKNLEMSLYF
jgi:glucosamine-phosphate N-acetyltransferase